jgi:signal transduction histidine kinase
VEDGPNDELIKKMDIRSMVIINLTHKDRLIGAIYLGSIGKTRQFDDEEKAFLATYGHHAASAIDRARLFEESRQRTMELEILSRLSTNLRLASSRKEMLPILLGEAFAITNAVAGALYLVGQDNQIIEGYQKDLIPSLGTWFRPGETLWTTALKDDKNLIHSEIFAPEVKSAEIDLTHNQLYEKAAIAFRSNQFITGLLVLGFTKHFFMDVSLNRVFLAFTDIAGNAFQRSGLMEMMEKQVADRTRELSTLYELTLITNTSRDLEQVLTASLEKVLAASEAQAAGIYKYDKSLSSLSLLANVALSKEILAQSSSIDLPDEVKPWLEVSSTPRLVFAETNDSLNFLPGSTSFGTGIYVPVQYEKITLGLLCILWENVMDLSAENISLIRAVAERLGSVIQNRTLSQQAEQVAVLEERQRLARELHDSVTQSIYSMTLLSEAGIDLAKKGDQEKLIDCLQEMQKSSLHTLQEMRLLLFELRPPKEKGLNLIEMLMRRLESVERRSGIRVEFNADSALFLSPHIEEEFFRVASEALNNSLKHSGSDVVKIRLQSTSSEFTMVIEDEGCGFDPNSGQHGGIGLESMRERVNHLGGKLEIFSQPGKGTRIVTGLKIKG